MDTWYPGTEGELQAIRTDSRDSQGAYAVIESVAQPGTAVPAHLHRNEDEHFLVLSGHYRIAIGDDVVDAPPGTRATVPRNTRHSWRNTADGESRLLVVLTPGGFEQIVQHVAVTAPEDIPALADRFGCELLGPPDV